MFIKVKGKRLYYQTWNSGNYFTNGGWSTSTRSFVYNPNTEKMKDVTIDLKTTKYGYLDTRIFTLIVVDENGQVKFNTLDNKNIEVEVAIINSDKLNSGCPFEDCIDFKTVSSNIFIKGSENLGICISSDNVDVFASLFNYLNNNGYEKVKNDFIKNVEDRTIFRLSLTTLFNYVYFYNNNEDVKWLIDNNYGYFIKYSFTYELPTVKKKIKYFKDIFYGEDYEKTPDYIKNAISKYGMSDIIYQLYKKRFSGADMKLFKKVFSSYSELSLRRYNSIAEFLPNKTPDEILNIIQEFKIDRINNNKKLTTVEFFDLFTRVKENLTIDKINEILSNENLSCVVELRKMFKNQKKDEKEKDKLEKINFFNKMSKFSEYILPKKIFGYNIEKINSAKDLKSYEMAAILNNIYWRAEYEGKESLAFRVSDSAGLANILIVDLERQNYREKCLNDENKYFLHSFELSEERKNILSEILYRFLYSKYEKATSLF